MNKLVLPLGGILNMLVKRTLQQKPQLVTRIQGDPFPSFIKNILEEAGKSPLKIRLNSRSFLPLHFLVCSRCFLLFHKSSSSISHTSTFVN